MWDYSLYLFALGVSSTTVGQALGFYLIKKKNQSSIVSLSMGFVLVTSAIMMTAETVELNFIRPREIASRRVHFPPPFSDLCKQRRT